MCGVHLIGSGYGILLTIKTTLACAFNVTHKCIYRERKLGECLLISSLPDKASRTLVGLQGFRSDSTCVLKAEPGKLDIKRDDPDVLFINLQFASSN